MALEFDTYPNNTSSDACASGSRNDPSPFNHTALMFWGDRTISGTCGGGYPKGSFDDNRHGTGGGADGSLQNSTGPGDPGYYQGANRTCKSSANTCKWMEDGYTYSARMEIVRPSTVNGSGTYDYQINAWILLKSSVSSWSIFRMS